MNSKKADIKTGFLCNNNCIFCVQGHKKKFGDKDTPKLKRIIKEAKDGCDAITFTGGEPTIRKDILELVRFAKKLGFKTIQIQSNGRMFAYEKFCQDMIKAGANEFALAVHGHNEKLHNYLTQAESFKQVISGIHNLKKLKQRVILNTVICRSNYRQLPEIAKLLVSLDVDQFQFAFVHALGAAEENFDSVVPRVSLVIPHLKRAIDIGWLMKKAVMVEGIPACFLPGYENHISENFMPDMKIFDLDNTIEDFKESRLAEGKLKGKKCRTCKNFPGCEGMWREYPLKFGWDEFLPIK